MKRKSSRKAIPTTEQANYILGMHDRIRQLMARVALLEADVYDLRRKAAMAMEA